MRPLRIPRGRLGTIPGIAILLATLVSGIARAQTVTLIEQCPELKSTAGNDTDETARSVAGVKDTNPGSRKLAILKLGQSCDRRAVAPLLESLKDTDAEVRTAAVEALGHLGDRSTIDPLIEMIRDPDWKVRTAVGRAGLQDAVPVLEEIAAGDRDASVRQSATEALAMLKQKNPPGH